MEMKTLRVKKKKNSNVKAKDMLILICLVKSIVYLTIKSGHKKCKRERYELFTF